MPKGQAARFIKVYDEYAKAPEVTRRRLHIEALLQPILTEGRQIAEGEVQELMQATLDNYGTGILVTQVQLQKVDPPQQVIDAFRDVQAARADAERVQNQAQTYANRNIPEARGKAAQIIHAAEAYRTQTVVEAACRVSSLSGRYGMTPEPPASASTMILSFPSNRRSIDRPITSRIALSATAVTVPSWLRTLNR